MRYVAIPAKTLQQIVSLLLFRLGGEQAFTTEEIKEIQSCVAGVQMQIDPTDSKIILRSRLGTAPKEEVQERYEEREQRYEDEEDYREEEEE
jgi:hypothetical protein